MSRKNIVIPSKICPRCKKIAVATFAFDKWEIFCPDCRIGDGIFNGWPIATDEDMDMQDERDKYFNDKMTNGDYLDMPNLNENYRKRIAQDSD